MFFDSKDKFFNYLKFMEDSGIIKKIGVGSQGICYLDFRNNKVYKIFHQFFDEEDEEFYIKYQKEDILRFSHIVNDTFIWSNDVIVVGSEIIGYISDYKNAKSLYKINPLKINLNTFSKFVRNVYKDIRIISDNGILTFDMMYNILYSNKGFFIIDHDDYSYFNSSNDYLYIKNCDNFNYEIMYFLVDNYFNEFVSSYSDLNNMYERKRIDINEFITLFRKHLSEYVGRDIIRLEDASCCFNKNKVKEIRYVRNYFNR